MRYVHTNIVARDWKRLSEFYIKVFACKEARLVHNLSGDWVDKGVGLKNVKISGIHLLLPGHGDNGPTLEIFTYENLYESSPIMPNFTGLTHIAFEVDDVEDTLQTALGNGAKPLGKITEKLIENVGILIFVYFRDPEGNIIEIQSWKK